LFTNDADDFYFNVREIDFAVLEDRNDIYYSLALN
jgi:hypothetical protein